MKSLFEVRPERTVPLEELEVEEALVLPAYFIEAGDEDEALEEFYWHAPIKDHTHFKVEVFERAA